MIDKKIRIMIAIAVALLVHIGASLFFLCLNTTANLAKPENITSIEIYNIANPVPASESISNLPVDNTKSTAEDSSVDKSVLKQSSPSLSAVPATVASAAPGSDAQGSAPSQPSTTAATGGRSGVPVVMPRVLSSVQPLYPLQAKNAGVEGRVYLKILVNAQGLVEKVSIANSSGNNSLDDAAKQAVLAWRFSPAKDEGGQLVSCYIRLPIDFNLKNMG